MTANEKIRALLDDFARQQLIVDSAQEELEMIESELIEAFGDRKDSVWGEDAVIAFEHGRRTLEWQKAAMLADIPTEKYRLYAKPAKIDWRKMCLNEGVAEEDVPFTRGPSKVKIEMATLEKD